MKAFCPYNQAHKLDYVLKKIHSVRKAMGGKSTKANKKQFLDFNLNNSDEEDGCHQSKAVGQDTRMDCVGKKYFPFVNSGIYLK